ncbi:MAG: T9SS type A sorting domain-containing protein [Bacteroidetes bacterium]|nr:T9SS type A sorting domain-containing protein [Bacteroidota bacterium]
MKKFTIILIVLIVMSITAKAQYSNATLNGAWLMSQTPITPYGDSLLYLVFDGNGNITDFSGFGYITGSNYSVNSSGAISGTIIVVDHGSFPIVGQLSSQNLGTLTTDGMNYVFSRIANQGALDSTITGTLSTVDCSQKTVTININNQGVITSATGLSMPVTGKVYADLGVFMGHIRTSSSLDVWDEFSIMGYYANNTLNGQIIFDAHNCGITSVQLIRQGATGIISVNSNKAKIEIFPNPANDIVTININNERNEVLEINIFNTISTLVKSETINQNQHEINIRNLSNGIYLVEIKSKAWSEKQKLIIQR